MTSTIEKSFFQLFSRAEGRTFWPLGVWGFDPEGIQCLSQYPRRRVLSNSVEPNQSVNRSSSQTSTRRTVQTLVFLLRCVSGLFLFLSDRRPRLDDRFRLLFHWGGRCFLMMQWQWVPQLRNDGKGMKMVCNMQEGNRNGVSRYLRWRRRRRRRLFFWVAPPGGCLPTGQLVPTQRSVPLSLGARAGGDSEAEMKFQ